MVGDILDAARDAPLPPSAPLPPRARVPMQWKQYRDDAAGPWWFSESQSIYLNRIRIAPSNIRLYVSPCWNTPSCSRGRYNEATGEHFIEGATEAWKQWLVDGNPWWGSVEDDSNFFYAVTGSRDPP